MGREIKVYEQYVNYIGSLHLSEDCKSGFWSLVDKINYCDFIYFCFKGKKLVLNFKEKPLEYCKIKCDKCGMLGSCLYTVGIHFGMNCWVLPKGTNITLTSEYLSRYDKHFKEEYYKRFDKFNLETELEKFKL